MVFYSFTFVLFFIVVFILYYLPIFKSAKIQNYILLLSSYFFYGWANLKILPILLFATVFFYFLGLKADNVKNDKQKTWLTSLGVISGVGMLLYFKYTNFFIETINDILKSVGLHADIHLLNIIMPLGISFFTFRLLAYVIDISRGKYNAAKDFVSFATYIAFFPSILSGPIDRPDGMLPQLKTLREFSYTNGVDGLRQILWGAFKKIVVADNIASFVNQVYGSYESYTGATLILIALLYTFQMYADFSGYTDMAIGVGRLLGLRMAKNFNYPLFAKNIADYWRRWHISLTSWLTDYIFMPINVKWRDWGKTGIILAIIVDFLVCGLWHGANWTFVVWGLYHGLLYIPLILSGKMFKKVKTETVKFGLPSFKSLLNMAFTFLLITFGLILFRSESIRSAGGYLFSIIKNFSFDISYFFKTKQLLLMTIISIIGVIIMLWAEWRAFINKNEYVKPGRLFIILLVLLLVFIGSYKDQMSFIYFNF